jgi:hypothetical protein
LAPIAAPPQQPGAPNRCHPGWGLVTLAGGLPGSAAALLIIIMAFYSSRQPGLAKVVFGIGLTGLALAFTLFMFMIVYGSKRSWLIFLGGCC